MTLNSRKRHNILLAVVLILSLTTLSCALLGGGGKEDEGQAAQPPATEEPTRPRSDKEPSTDEQPTKGPAQEESEPPASASGEAGMFANPEEVLDSYRMRTKMTLKEGMGMLGEEMISEIEWVRDSEARHTTMYGASGEVMMELILIGDDTWTSMDGQTWMHATQTQPEESPIDPQEFQTTLEDFMKDMEGGLNKEGKEKVNDVNCIRYAVNADFSVPFPIPEDAAEEATAFLPKEMAGHVEGTIWVADESDLPEVIVRSVTTQQVTLKYESRDDETSVYDEERDLYDINERIVIEPPKGNVQEMPTMPTPPASGEQPPPPAEGQGETPEFASLDTLDSYRLEWSVTMKTNDGDVRQSYELEWVKDPPAYHIAMSIGGPEMLVEHIWVDGVFWTKSGDAWVQGGEAAAEDALSQAWDVMAPSDDMIAMGEETVNGVRCKHYVKDLTTPYTVHEEIAIADQGGLPPVVVQGIQQTEMGAVVTVLEANVYDINTPITIESPQ